MKLLKWIFSFFSGFRIYAPAQEQGRLLKYSPDLIPDEQGILLSPDLIPDNFLETKRIEQYRLQLAEMLELDEESLDYSINSLGIIEKAKNKEKHKYLLNNLHLYLPLLSYISQVVIKQRPGKLTLEKEKTLTYDPANGYPNVYIPKLIVIFNDKGKENISRILGKEFSRAFHYTLHQTVELILEAGTHK